MHYFMPAALVCAGKCYGLLTVKSTHSKAQVSKYTLPFASYASPFWMMVLMYATISGMYSLTRGMAVGRRTPAHPSCRHVPPALPLCGDV